MEIVRMVRACGLCSYLSAGLSLVLIDGTSLLSLISKYDTPGLTESVVLTGYRTMQHLPTMSENPRICSSETRQNGITRCPEGHRILKAANA